jgi:RNA polymerase sigma factor (TIGR02999 family)
MRTFEQPDKKNPSDVTILLQAVANGDSQGANKLLDLVYQDLRRLAAAKMAGESQGQTLQATALVHEAWVRLTNDENRAWNDRSHFFAAAAEAMRRILVDNARRKRAHRHGGNHQRVDLPEIAICSTESDDQLLAVNEAFEKFAKAEPQKAELVKLRYFVGMTIEEAARALNISEATAKRHWVYSRAWLAQEIKASADCAPR